MRLIENETKGFVKNILTAINEAENVSNKDIAKDIIKNYKEITGRDLVDILDDNGNIIQSVIEETSDAIINYVMDKYGVDITREAEDVLYILDEEILKIRDTLPKYKDSEETKDTEVDESCKIKEAAKINRTKKSANKLNESAELERLKRQAKRDLIKDLSQGDLVLDYASHYIEDLEEDGDLDDLSEDEVDELYEYISDLESKLTENEKKSHRIKEADKINHRMTNFKK